MANQRLAVVFGNSDYQYLERLKNATNDARAVGDQLQSLGYNVSLGLNRTRYEMLHDLDDVLDAWKHDAEEVVLFYAGHGVAMGRLYL